MFSDTLPFEPDADAITPEFRGLFRSFRRKIEAADKAFTVKADHVMDVLQGHMDRRGKPTLRPEHIPPILAQLKDVGSFGQRVAPRLTSSKRGFMLSAVRLATDWCRHVDWDEDAMELGLALVIFRVYPVYRKKYSGPRGFYGHYTDWYETHHRISSYVHFAGHALSRWHQRSFNPDEDSLIEAIWAAYDTYHDLVPAIAKTLKETGGEDGEFHLEVPGCGEWRGEVSIMQDSYTDTSLAEPPTSVCLNIRTFI